ncbi:invasion associated locus B family protein [Pararhizobium sp. IMCC21322]|uniref:invasion associated locus B family protein n=1 Tax=Pararhizobium sp. IMCC21322 TaxID=3067903 RepID=UPI0027428ED2|nr:invasion associated locus B family protein [Pararhizobium sp. IMCC21322]
MAFSKKQTLTRLLPVLAPLILVTSPDVSSAQEAAEGPKPWTKICTQNKQTKKEICLVSQEIRSANGQFLASVAVREIDGDENQSILISVPPGMLLQPGIQFKVDENEPRAVKYGICFQKYCYSELPIKKDAIDEMKGGNNLTVTTFSQQGKAIGFELTLTGFTATYDGDPIDPAIVQAQREKARQEMADKAQQARDNLIKMQQEATQ